MQMQPGNGNDFSSIARRLLLGRNRISTPRPPYSIGDVHVTKPNDSPKVTLDIHKTARRVVLARAHGTAPEISLHSIVDAHETKHQANSGSETKPNNDEGLDVQSYSKIQTARRTLFTCARGVDPEIPSCSFAVTHEIKREADGDFEVRQQDDQIAHHILLIRAPGTDSESPSCSVADTDQSKPGGDDCFKMKSQDDEMNAMDLIFNRESSSTPDEVMLLEDSEHHSCDLCDRIHSLSVERLTAPLEKPRPGKEKFKQKAARQCMGSDAKLVVYNVRRFFTALKHDLGYRCKRTLFKSVLNMTSLACGVSVVSVARISKDLHVEGSKENNLRCQILQNYGPEWGTIVRHFVLTEIEQYTHVSVPELYGKLRYAFADFPFSLTLLYAFLRSLGFKFRRVGKKKCIFSNDESKERGKSRSSCDDVEDMRLSTEHSEENEDEHSDYEMDLIDDDELLDDDVDTEVDTDEYCDLNNV